MKRVIASTLKSTAAFVESPGTIKTYAKYHARNTFFFLDDTPERVKDREGDIAPLFSSQEERQKYQRIYARAHIVGPLAFMACAAWYSTEVRRSDALDDLGRITVAGIAGLLATHLAAVTVPVGALLLATSYVRKFRHQ